MLLRTASGTLPRTTTSETANRPKGFTENAIFVGGEIDDAVRDDNVDRVVGQRDVLDLTFQELDIRDSRLLLVFTRERQHIVRHVQPICFASCADALCREQNVDAATGAEVKNGLSRSKIDQRGRIAAPERSQGGLLWNDPGLVRIVEVRSDRIAAPQAGFATRLHTAGLRDCPRGASVLLLDLYLNAHHRFHNCLPSHTLKRMYSSLDVSVKTHIIGA